MRSYLNEHFVCVASDVDAMEPEVQALAAAHLSHVMTLPYVIVVDQQGGWVTGGGGRDAVGRVGDLSLMREASGQT